MNKYLITLFFIICSSATFAAKADEKLEFHGFIEQGFIYTTNNPYYTDTASGSADFRELALNGSWQASDNFRLAGQVLARQAGDSGNDYVDIDFLLADYQAYGNDAIQLGVRAGRFKIPYGIYNSTRDTSASHAGAFVPNSVYFNTFRSLMLSSDGVNLYGAYTGENGYFSLDLYMGTRSLDDDSFEQYIFLSDIAGEFNDVDINGFKLSYIPDGAHDLNFALSLASPSFELANAPSFEGVALLNAFKDLSQNPQSFEKYFTDIDVDNHLYVASMQYGWQNWLFTAEYMYVNTSFSDIALLHQPQPEQDFSSNGFYIQGELFLSSEFQGFWRYEELEFDIDNNSTSEFKTERSKSESFNYSKGVTIGVRWHFSENLFLSTQYSANEGTAWLPVFEGRDNDALKKYWQLLAFQLTYGF